MASRGNHRAARRGKKRAIVGTVVAVSLVATAGAAWAYIASTATAPGFNTGAANTSTTATCQTGAIAFEWPSPTWSDGTGNYMVSTLDYSGIDAACITLATADLQVNVSLAGSTVSASNATASNMSAATGTLTLSTPLAFNDVSTSKVNFYVKNA